MKRWVFFLFFSPLSVYDITISVKRNTVLFIMIGILSILNLLIAKITETSADLPEKQLCLTHCQS